MSFLRIYIFIFPKSKCLPQLWRDGRKKKCVIPFKNLDGLELLTVSVLPEHTESEEDLASFRGN